MIIIFLSPKSSSWFECQHPTWHVTCKSRHRILVHCRCKWLALLARTGSSTSGFSDTDDTHAQPCTRARDRTRTTLNCRKYRQLHVRCPQSYKVWSMTNKNTKMPRQIMHKSSKLIGLLGKHGRFCFSQPYSTCNSVFQIVRTGRSIFITGNRRRRKNWRVVNKCSRRLQDAWLMRLGFTNSRQHEHVTRYRGDVWVLNRKLTLCSICWVRKVRSWGESISLRLKNWWILW